MVKNCDFLVIGSGLAGLSYALKMAPYGQVVILSKTTVTNTNTSMAQGGIAAVMSEDDSFDEHIRDTINAGAGLCNPEIVREVVESAPNRIKDLIDWGVHFDISDERGGKVDLTREGGHSQRRILHVQDHTGQDIHAELRKRVLENPNIQILENHFAVDLITSHDTEPSRVGPARCLGAYVFDKTQSKFWEYYARITLLATGGAGKVYQYTSNWSGATGDGIAMAYRAGARVANLEFMQFHPTCLYHPSARNLLISEAVRGEGGELINSKGVAFTKAHHPMGSLAPRDIVARAIDAELKRSGENSVFLDITHRSPEFILKHFPVIHRNCLAFGIDMTKEPIPVVPAAHYLCGGVLTDREGRTDIPGLLAAGETTCTGLHGANRLASNSLLECLVFADNAATYTIRNLDQLTMPVLAQRDWADFQEQDEDEMILIAHMWEEIRRLMWNYVGIVRSNRRLERAKKRMDLISAEMKDYYGSSKLHPDIIELRNIATVADLTIRCALLRRESRGIHYNIDFPRLNDIPRDTIVSL